MPNAVLEIPLYFGKIMFGAMVLSKYCVNDGSNRDQKNITTQNDTEVTDGHEKRISTKYGLFSCVVTIIGSYAHACLLSPSAFYFDDNEPFFQFTRELLDVPLAYSMFWSIQQIYATMKTYNIQILESVMENLYRIVIHQSRQIEVSSFSLVIWVRIVVQEGFGFGRIVYCVLRGCTVDVSFALIVIR